jgi:hypothetical protein
MPWLKLGYFETLRTAADWRELDWVADGPGRRSPRWDGRPQPRAGTPRPPYAPSYAIGDRLVVYSSRSGRCPAILEVTEAPVWDPALVDRRYPGEGERWGVVTRVRVLGAADDPDDAPRLEEVGVARRSVGRKSYLRIEPWMLARACAALGAAGAGAVEAPTASAAFVPVEAGDVTTYDVRAPATGALARRREAGLVRDLAAHLRGLGHEVGRNRLPGVEHAAPQFTDLFDATTGLLVEAKASTARADVRMAIGQLADYARAVRPARRAVLLDALPHPDLVALLESCGIGVIWRSGHAFGASDATLIS